MDDLTRDLPIDCSGSPAARIAGITHDSRRVREGDLYVALVGERFDGHRFVPDALERGAAAVLASAASPDGIRVPWLRAEEPRRLLGPLARRLYGAPDDELIHVGVTGTNGKSTVVALLAAMLQAAERPAGRIGTLGYVFGDLRRTAERTTPEATEYFRLLREMRDRGAAAVVAEVSSHALAQGRVATARYDLAVFTNLSRDHLDYHGDLESYFAAKRLLFDLVEPGRAAINADDPWGRRLLESLPGALGFGRQGEVRLDEIALDLDGSRGVIETPRGRLAFETRLIGQYNMENLLAAVCGAELLGLPHEAVVEALAGIEPLPGRLERVPAPGPVIAVVDFAHTDAALEAALRSMRRLSDRRLIVVFGCGGERDRGKRAPMGRVAGEFADLAVLTSDNPRGEDPGQILREVESGLGESEGAVYEVEPDRKRAIRRAVEAADERSIVLVAGKGHEREQILGERRLPFSDQDEVRTALEERFGTSTAG